MERLTPLADYSPQWIQHAVDYILDNGMFRPEDLQEALDDPTILNVADQILKKAAQ